LKKKEYPPDAKITVRYRVWKEFEWSKKDKPDIDQNIIEVKWNEL
jgi:hypothetical protein